MTVLTKPAMNVRSGMNALAQPTAIIIGAGPFGLSIAAHLRHAGIDFRIFGTPMHRWRAQMPKGMYLKSEGCGSSLSDPTGEYTLGHFCAEKGLTYGDYGVPVPLDTFTEYGLSFQRRLVPGVEDVMVTALDKSGDLFEARLDTGETVRTRKVVVATGLAHAAYMPPEIAALPAEIRSHSEDHHDLSRFKGKEVAVIGGGQSALETAALLRECGADVHLLVREPSLAWNPDPDLRHRSLYRRLRYPKSNLGDGLRLWIYANKPKIFYYMPLRSRLYRVATTLGPAGAWWLRDRVMGRMPIALDCAVGAAEARHDRAILHLQGPNGERTSLGVDHVIAATGYRCTVSSLRFLSERLRSSLRSVYDTPILSPNFEASVSGLYFTGAPSANSFGPAMRFVHGAHYTARSISDHIASRQRHGETPAATRPARPPKCKES